MKKLVMMLVLATSASILQAAGRRLESPVAEQMLAALQLAEGMHELRNMQEDMPEGMFEAVVIPELEVMGQLGVAVEGALQSCDLPVDVPGLAALSTAGMVEYLGTLGIKKALENRKERRKDYLEKLHDPKFIQSQKDDLDTSAKALSALQRVVSKNVELLDRLERGELPNEENEQASKALETGRFAFGGILWALVYGNDICGNLEDESVDGSLSGDDEDNNPSDSDDDLDDDRPYSPATSRKHLEEFKKKFDQ